MAAIKLYEENIAVQCGYSFIEQQKNECETFNQGIAIARSISFFLFEKNLNQNCSSFCVLLKRKTAGS